MYAVAQDVLLNCPEEFPDTHVRLGGFHTLGTDIACVGKLYADRGLFEMLVGSGVYASGSALLMIEGRQFHRAVRTLTLIYDALMQLMIKNFFLQPGVFI